MAVKVPLVKVPPVVNPGEDFMIRAKVWHPMETGWRKTHDGGTVPRNRIHTFTCSFNGVGVFSADFHSGVAENPYLTFTARVEEAGTFRFQWRGDDGLALHAVAKVTLAVG